MKATWNRAGGEVRVDGHESLGVAATKTEAYQLIARAGLTRLRDFGLVAAGSPLREVAVTRQNH